MTSYTLSVVGRNAVFNKGTALDNSAPVAVPAARSGVPFHRGDPRVDVVDNRLGRPGSYLLEQPGSHRASDAETGRGMNRRNIVMGDDEHGPAHRHEANETATGIHCGPNVLDRQ